MTYFTHFSAKQGKSGSNNLALISSSSISGISTCWTKAVLPLATPASDSVKRSLLGFVNMPLFLSSFSVPFLWSGDSDERFILLVLKQHACDSLCLLGPHFLRNVCFVMLQGRSETESVIVLTKVTVFLHTSPPDNILLIYSMPIPVTSNQLTMIQIATCCCSCWMMIGHYTVSCPQLYISRLYQDFMR